MAALSTTLRNKLERTIIEARNVAEEAARAALERLSVGQAEAYAHLSEHERQLRTKLRAHGKQIGDVRAANKTQSLDRLTQELAYEYWHRMLFARFLAENHLLIKPDDDIAVTLEECEYYANEQGTDKWSLAGRYASQMLPQIFRPDDPLLQVPFSRERKQDLEGLLASLHEEVFKAGDSLGWCYQFWQAERKDEVNKSGRKIGAEELPAVTQLFTEDYMVDFLLDNTLGAWHAGKVLAADPRLAQSAQSEEELREAVSLPGCPWKYLRFLKCEDGQWTPAAGTFDGWPKTAKELKCLDPCMGSGHFVVAMFERLVSLRMAEEMLDTPAAVAAAIRDNLFGLEIDPRCTQIGAFNLALAAWRRVGHCRLPAMNLACSGLAPNTREADWLAIAGDNQKLQRGMERLYRLFQKAAVLGSLINPRAGEDDLLEAGFHELQPLLEQALSQETQDDTAHEMAVTARGLAKAADILAGQFTLVATNVPYLGRPKQDEILTDYCERVHPEAKADLATCFVERGLAFCVAGGTATLVTPQNWLSQPRYTNLRERILRSVVFDWCFRLGEHAFESPQAAGAFVAIVSLSRSPVKSGHEIAAGDFAEAPSPDAKAQKLLLSQLLALSQAAQAKNPEGRIEFSESETTQRLMRYAKSIQGLATSDDPQFTICFWELPAISNGWCGLMGTVLDTIPFGGREQLILWEDGRGRYFRHAMALKEEGRMGGWKSGTEAREKRGVLISQMRQLPVTLYLGEFYDHNACVFIPEDPSHLAAIWAFCESEEFNAGVRTFDQALKPSNNTLLKVPFDLAHWQKVAAEKYPHGLPKPFSSDPTQWLFNGHPKDSDQPLHVAVARLLGYRWPRQTGSSFPDCPALGPDGLETLADNDGIVCIPAVRGERPADARLLDVLRAAYGSEWSPQLLDKLIQQAGGGSGQSLDDWLRNTFFEQHCKLFHQRPFIWHIWDGRKKDGFHALVNYHKLDRKRLETLIYSYLGDWITHLKSDEEGNEARILAAEELKENLEAILHGEEPYDIFVRWKPLQEQPVGWEPDLNDGVRMNIRPFVEAGVLRKPPRIKWNTDRGKEPEREKDEYPWFWSGNTFTGERINDVHLSLEQKRAAGESKPAKREQKPAKPKGKLTAKRSR